MFGLFKKKKWELKSIKKLEGNFQKMSIEIYNFPFKEDIQGGKRVFPYSDFGLEFITELHKELGDYSLVKEELQFSGKKIIFVKLRNFSPMQVIISGNIGKNQDEADSNIADTLLEAFYSEKIKRV